MQLLHCYRTKLEFHAATVLNELPLVVFLCLICVLREGLNLFVKITRPLQHSLIDPPPPPILKTTGKTLLFYGVFYGMLSAFWISCFTGMQSYIPAYEDGPELQDIIQDTENIYLQNYPARYENTKDMVTFPGEVPSLESNDEDWAVFPAGDENEGYSVDPFGRIVEKLDEWLLEYTDQTIDVTDGQITNIKTFCGEYYGFDTMQPCFFLKLNRIRGRTLRGSNELADSCANGGADEEEGWKLGDEWKVMEKRNCAASGASFLPITCVEKITGENGVQVVSPLKFTVKSWLDATDYESDVKGLAFVPFLNTVSAYLL